MLWAHDGISPLLANELPPQTGGSLGLASTQHPGLGEPGVTPATRLPTAQPDALPAATGLNCCLSLINLDLFLLSALCHHFACPQRRGFSCQSHPRGGARGFPAVGSPQDPHPAGSTGLAWAVLWPGTPWSFHQPLNSIPGAGPSCKNLAEGRSVWGGWC